MLSGICPKCGSDEVYSSPKLYKQYVPLSTWRGSAKIILCCCASCGYIEEYVREEDRDEIARNWRRIVPGEKRKRDDDS